MTGSAAVDRDGAVGVGDGRGPLVGERGAGLHRDGVRVGDDLVLQRVDAGGDGERPALASLPLRMTSALKVEGAVVGDGAGGDGGVRRLTMAAAVTAELPASTVMVPSVLAIEVRRWSAWRRPAP